MVAKLRIPVLLLGSLALTTGALARVGESESKCKERYGEPAETELELAKAITEGGATWKAASYTTRGLRIQVVFRDGTAVFIKYANAPVFSLNPSRSASLDLSESEISHLRKINAEGENWGRHREPLVAKLAPQLTVWSTNGEKHFAAYNREQKELFICESDFWELVVGEVKKRAEEGAGDNASKRLEGL